MKKIFCDKCKGAADDQSPLTVVFGWVREPEWKAEADLCEPCRGQILELLTKFFDGSFPSVLSRPRLDQGDRR